MFSQIMPIVKVKGIYWIFFYEAQSVVHLNPRGTLKTMKTIDFLFKKIMTKCSPI